MICLAAGTVAVMLATQSFTLTWVHSVEHTEIQEDYRQEGEGLRLTDARIRGSGAGFDPPAGAQLANGWWHYRPHLSLEAVTLARADAPGDWMLCFDGTCRSLEAYLTRAQPDQPARIAACR